MVVFGATGEARPLGPALEAGGSPVSSFGRQAALALASQSPRQWHPTPVTLRGGQKNKSRCNRGFRSFFSLLRRKERLNLSPERNRACRIETGMVIPHVPRTL